jgi:hypothetical protein
MDEKKWSWRQAIDRRTEFLVEQADETISPERLKTLRRDLKASQLSNLLAVAQGTDSQAAIVNWIRYQMGRKGTGRAWGNTGLGEDVIRRIGRLGEEAKTIAGEVYENPTPAQQQEIHAALIRQYVGYVRRWFIARGGDES